MMSNLSKLKWRDVEAEFGEKVDQIREDVRQMEDNPNYRDEPVDPKLVLLLESHPHLAILEGWKSLEKAIVDLSVSRLQTERRLPFNKHLDALMRAEILPNSMKSALGEIRDVRNRAVHESDQTISKGRAYVLLDSIADIVGFLNKLV